MKKSFLPHLNILTLIVTHFFWGYVNILYAINIQPFIIALIGTDSEAASILGLILSIGTLSAVIPLFFGYLGDWYGRKKLILAGQLFNVIGMLGIGFFSSNIYYSVVWIIIFNIGVGFYDPPLQGLIYESSRAVNRGRVYSVIYNAASIGGILGALFIQLLGDEVMLGLFQSGSLILFFTLLFNFIFLKDLHPNFKKARIPIKQFLTDPFTGTTALAFIIDTFAWGLSLSILNGVLILVFDVDSSFLGEITLIQSLLLVILQFPAGYLVDKIGRTFGLLMGEFVGICWISILFYTFTFPSSFALDLVVIASGVLGVSIAFWRPAVTLSFIEVDKSAVATNFGILTFIQRMGWVPTAAIGGFLFSLLNFQILLLITFFGTLIVVYLFLRLEKIGKTRLEISFP
ncbi:MFS transporter [Candidatus Hodarchaeum mangrovi]